MTLNRLAAQKLADELALHVAVEKAEAREIPWTAELVVARNRSWLKANAPDVRVPNAEQEALCAKCNGLCLLVATVFKGIAFYFVHACTACGEEWLVPETVYYDQANPKEKPADG